jgi:hypothetical protein
MKCYIYLIVIILSCCKGINTAKKILPDFYSGVEVKPVYNIKQNSDDHVVVIQFMISSVNGEDMIIPKEFDRRVTYEIWKNQEKIDGVNADGVTRLISEEYNDSDDDKDDFPSVLKKNEIFTSWVAVRYGLKTSNNNSDQDPFVMHGESFDCDFDITSLINAESDDNIFEVRMISNDNGIVIASAYLNIWAN